MNWTMFISILIFACFYAVMLLSFLAAAKQADDQQEAISQKVAIWLSNAGGEH